MMKKRGEKQADAGPLTLDSTIGRFYENPVGHDALAKVLLQLGVSEKVLTNKILSNLKLKTIAKLTGKKLGADFYEALLKLVNSEQDAAPAVKDGRITRKWWKEAVFYQIYPRSFCDSNGDGIGDLQGIISKLDYLKSLGVDALWLSPVYDSPNDDNGYDIRDYYAIMREFGTMADFDCLLQQVHERGMRLIMDLVVNHTSDEHSWYRQALADRNSPYREYYFFREDDGSGQPPNNWASFFSGPAWNYNEADHSWSLHLFSKKQMDLNWDNPKVREDVITMINWWLDKGVDGFRMDVINYISKAEGLPRGNEAIGSLMGYPGIEQYYYGPNLHRYLKEIHDRAFAPHQAFSVGETPGLGMMMSRLVTGEERGELDMVFSFDHLETPGHVRMENYEYDLNYFRDYMIDWQEHYGDNCWMSLFYNNHDNPRMISKITGDVSRHAPLAKLLAVMQFTLKGTPFVFQGDEMGLANYEFTSMEQITDVEAKGYYEEHIRTQPAKEVFAAILAGTREHTRVLLPWNKTLPSWHEGLFQEIKEDVRETYRKLIGLRRREEALVYGSFRLLGSKKNRFVYERVLGNEVCLIDCNLGKRPCGAYLSHLARTASGEDWELLYSTADGAGSMDAAKQADTAGNADADTAESAGAVRLLRGYEARIWKRK